jgi:hypothetical protein
MHVVFPQGSALAKIQQSPYGDVTDEGVHFTGADVWMRVDLEFL